MIKGKKLLNSFGWEFLGRIFKQCIGFFIGILLARLLGPEKFGLIAMSTALVSIASFFISTGLFTALIQYEGPKESHLSSVFFYNLVIGVLLLTIFYFGAPWMTYLLKAPNLFTEVIRFVSLTFLISSFTQVQEALFRRELKIKELALINFAATLVGGITGIFLALLDCGVWSLVAYLLIERTTFCISVWIKSHWKPKLIFRIRAIKDLWPFGFRMFLAGLVKNFVAQIDSIIISRSFGITELGLFSRAKTLNNFVTRYSSESIGNIMFPAMAKLQTDKHKLVVLGLRSERIISFLCFGLLGWMYLTAEELILLLLGDDWKEAVPIYQILCLSGFSYPLGVATSSMLKAVGNGSLFLRLEVYKQIVMVLGLSVGFVYGLRGYLISLIITGSICVLINLYFSARYFGFNLRTHFVNLSKFLFIAVGSVLLTNLYDYEKISEIGRFLLKTFGYSGIFLTLLYLIEKDAKRFLWDIKK
ncbi:lipopolysaccharide biosynthesis protein [Akkermansiaceae bacterium]|nr:lipopolysaccharide biosynthesis protein [Akkermansiaceae bacterium]